MQYEIFLEVVFVQYAVIALCVMVFAAAMRGLRMNVFRLILGVCAGGGLGCAGLTAGRMWPFMPALLLVITVLFLAAVAFPFVSMRNYRKNAFAVFLSMFLVGGISVVLHHRVHILRDIVWFSGVLLFCAVLCAYLMKYLKARQCLIYPVTLFFDEEIKSVRALADSGNRIKDANGQTVCVLEQQLVPDDFTLEAEYLIRTLGAEEQGLKGGVIEKMIVHTREGNLVYKNVPLAIYQGRVSGAGKFEMILPSNYCIRE